MTHAHEDLIRSSQRAPQRQIKRNLLMQLHTDQVEIVSLRQKRALTTNDGTRHPRVDLLSFPVSKVLKWLFLHLLRRRKVKTTRCVAVAASSIVRGSRHMHGARNHAFGRVCAVLMSRLACKLMGSHAVCSRCLSVQRGVVCCGNDVG